ncbi:hypothetical protein [Beijerinckia sp. L45]|uniref:hypothetical protein n=1 Tax=Beijerinckia sp. L45 TaxID=1641855 RepID=UPI00131C58B8|nr:hypothetical protein [Beijerinckia sp. L45]
MIDDGDKRIPISEAAEPDLRGEVRVETIDGRAPEVIDPRHRDAVMEGLEQSKVGRFASQKDLGMVVQRLRL